MLIQKLLLPLHQQATKGATKIMNIKDAKVGTRVVRSKGDYVVGRTGTIVEIDEAKNRARVDWDKETKSQVNFNSLEPENIPYKIETFYEDKFRNKRTGHFPYPKYTRI